MSMKHKNDGNACPHHDFIKALAQELGITQILARHVYTVFYVVILKLLKEYDTVSVTPFLKLTRKMTKEKNMYDVNSGEYVTTVPQEKLYCRIASRYQHVGYFDRYLVEYEEKLRKQEEYEIQKEQERLEREQEKELNRKQLAQERRKKRLKSKRRRRKEAERVRAIERMIHYESILEQHEKEKYRKELARRKKGYK